LLATGCYRHADTSRPRPFDSPWQADSNISLPDTGGHLPTAVSPFFFLRTSIAMRTLRNLYLSIPLTKRNPTHSVRTLSDPLPKFYPYFCTLVLQASTFKLLATKCYRHADTLRLIPFESPWRADSNETLPNPSGHLPTKVSPFFSPLTSIALRTLQNLYHSISLA